MSIVGVLFDGIAYGSLMFLIAIGLSITLGLMNFVNLAHGAFAMLGGYACVMLMTRAGVPFLVTLPVAFAVAAGIPEERVCLDPGIGFGKTADHNVTVLCHLGALSTLGRPVLLGTSRKSTLGRILDLPAEERLEATLATTALGIAAGVDIVRVHDVGPNVRVARVSDAIVRGHWREHADGDAR